MLIPKWAWYAAAWFGGRALLSGLPLDQGLTLAINMPLAMPSELASAAAAQQAANLVQSLTTALAPLDPFGGGPAS